jgi:hypothetical protein
MTEDQDNAGEVVAGAVRVALTAAGQLAEQAARRREADLREAERESAARVATLQSQLAAERELALRSVRDVVQRGDVATVDDVMRAWEQARGWDNPTMGFERAQLEERIRERFGVDAAHLTVDRGASERVTATALIARDVELQVSDADRRDSARDRVAERQGGLIDAGIDEDAAAARALAAESHPTPVARAAQSPGGAVTGRPRGRRRHQSVELQAPGR